MRPKKIKTILYQYKKRQKQKISIVLPHFLQNLQYIQNETDIKKVQISLNLSRVYGDHAGLVANIGIRPPKLTQCVHDAHLHLRLTRTRLDTLIALLFKKLNTPLPLFNLHPITLDYYIRYTTHKFNIDTH